MARKLQVALVGAGGIGQYWDTAFKGYRGARLLYVVDVDESRARAVAGNHPGCTSTEDIAVALNDSAVDAVIIATPHAYLAPLSEQALNAGKHVLCEKPGGISASELRRVVTLSQKKKKVYMTGFNHRYHPAYLKAKELLTSKRFGKILFLRARYGFRGRPGYEKEWRFNKKISGGGELLDQGIHMIDLARLLVGDFKDVQGFVENRYWGGSVEDNAFIQLRTKEKSVAQIHVSWTEATWVHTCEISCEKGFISISGLDERYGGPEQIVFGANDRRKGEFDTPTTLVFKSEKKEDSFRRELDAFCKMVDGKRQDSSGKDAVAALSIVEKIYAKEK